MKKKIMKKKILVAGMALAALLAMPQMTASASGTAQTMEVVEAIPTETGESTLPEQVLPEVNAADGIIASGQSGNITWVIDGNGKLTVEGTGDLVGTHSSGNWMLYKEQIISAEINVSGMTDASYLFYDCSNLINVDVSGFDTSNVTDMSSMFSGCSSLTGLDVSGFDTSNVTDMRFMFSGCSSLTGLDVSGFDTSNVTNMDAMFQLCYRLTSLDVSSFDTSKVTDMSGMFVFCDSLTSVDVRGFDTSNVTNMSAMFNVCSSLTSVDVRGFDTSNVTNMSAMFALCDSLTSVDVSGFDTSNVTDMSAMFDGCSSLTSVDVSSFDTSKVTDMSNMFVLCDSLTSVDVRGFDTSKVTNMESMFADCGSLISVDVSSFDTSKVTDMSGMFDGCSSLTSVDVSGFDTSKVTDVSFMFADCGSLTSVDVSSFDTSKVTDMSAMFDGCSSLTGVDVSSFDTSSVIDMCQMFYNCRNLTSLDISDFDPSSVKMLEWKDGVKTSGAGNMFSGCDELITIKVFKVASKEATCNLPTYYVDETGNRTNEITAAFVGKTLTREGADIPLPTPVNPPSGETIQKVQNFVSRMYTVALGRAAEEAGLNDWTNRLLAHEIDGAGIANGFIMSDEFKNRNLSNEDFVDTLYRTFFDREADQGGRATWLAELAAGKSRSYVLAGFVNSTEFDNLCDAYGIARGTMREDGTPVNAGIRSFVERCYTKVLGREGEKAGVEDWTNRIATGAMSAEDVAKSFFFSEEYTNKNTDNETFVETLYQTFMDRASDPAGKSDWLGRLGAGTGRQEVLEGFSRSEEFAGILRSYGL